MSFSVEIDTATPMLKRLALTIGSTQKTNDVAAFAVVKMLRHHFTVLDASRSGRQFGGQNASHFYGKLVSTIRYVADSTSATVGVGTEETRGIRFRLKGGTIEAGKNISAITGKPTVYLTIPARGEAYGHRAGEFPLQMLFGPGGHGIALVEKLEIFNRKSSRKTPRALNSVGVKGPAKTTGGEVWYWLVKSVTQDPDPSVMPSEDWMGETAALAVSRFVKGVLRKGGIDSEPESE